VLARYGGEEFIVLLPDTAVREGVVVAERMRRKIQKTEFWTEKSSISITASFGVSDSLVQTDGKEQEIVLSEFVANADRALYTSKNSGRNKVTVFER
jgi:diguanylate cyclase (GGDEF)-like protein